MCTHVYTYIYLMSILRADSITLDSQVTLYMYIHGLMRDEERSKQGQNMYMYADAYTIRTNNYGELPIALCVHTHTLQTMEVLLLTTGGREETQLDGLILHSGSIRRRRTPKHDYSHSISLSYETGVVITLYPFLMRRVWWSRGETNTTRRI